MNLQDLAGPDCKVSGDAKITSLAVDSRKVARGCLFAAMPGTKVDGAKFVPQAVAQGAAAVLVDSNTQLSEISVPVLRSDDPRRALSLIAAKFYPRQPDVMAAVTGTAGKTSVASFLRQIWAFDKKQAAMIGTTGVFAPGRAEHGLLTTPDPIILHKLLDELAGDGVTHCSMEASSHGLDQRRLDGVRLTVGGFTNLGRDHMDYHATVDDYLNAKLRLFDTLMDKGQPAIIFADDDFSHPTIKAATLAGLDVRTVGRAGNWFKLKRVEQHRYSQVGEIEVEGTVHRVNLPMAGEFQMANALVAAGMAIASGTQIEIAFAALQQLVGAPGRLELIGQTGEGAPIYVDYAHKPDALEKVLTALQPYTTGDLVLVFGCGGDRDKGKRPLMGEIGQRLADKVIVTDDNPRTEDAGQVRSEILVAAPDALEIGDRAEAIQHAIANLKAGDTLIVAGKGHEEGQIVGDVTLPFSDHQVVRQALEAAQ